MEKFNNPESRISIEYIRHTLPGKDFPDPGDPVDVEVYLDLRKEDVHIRRLREYDELEIQAGGVWNIRISKELASLIERIETLGADEVY